MLDLSFGELLIIALVLLVVVGPRELPTMLRKLGQGVAKLRNMTWQLREQSGIDEVLREEGLDKDLDALRSLSRGRVVDAIMTEAARVKPADDADTPMIETTAAAPPGTRPLESPAVGVAEPPPGEEPSEPPPASPEEKQRP